MFAKNSNIKLKRKIDGNIIFYSQCNVFSFKKFATIDEEEICNILKKVFWKAEKNTESKNSKVVKTNNEKMMLLLNCVVFNDKLLLKIIEIIIEIIIEKQKATGILSNLGLQVPFLSDLPGLNVLF